MTEALLEKKFQRYLHKYFPVVLTQVPFISRVIDIVALSKNGQMTSYELKLKDWKRAIKQIQNHSLATHFSYLCMPQQSLSPERIERIKKILQARGFGFIVWDEHTNTAKTIIRAKRNLYRSTYATQHLKNNIKEKQLCKKK